MLCTDPTQKKSGKTKNRKCTRILHQDLKIAKFIPTMVDNIKDLYTKQTSLGKNKYLLLGGTNKRKRKRVDYAKLNNNGFDNFDHVSKIQAQSECILNIRNDYSQLEKNMKIQPLVSSLTHEVNVLKMRVVAKNMLKRQIQKLLSKIKKM